MAVYSKPGLIAQYQLQQLSSCSSLCYVRQSPEQLCPKDRIQHWERAPPTCQ